ncbi:MAG: creatininase [Anaerolineales bacterium]|nr:creatininase [Anaerolineales bacterium]
MLAERMTWMEYRDKVKRSVVILPMGSFEQHGPHLPLCVDAVIPTSFAKLVAEKVDGMVLPPLTYGYKSQPTSGGGPLFPGTTSLDGSTLIHLVLDILRDTYRHGGKKFLLLNGHYENVAFATEAVDLFLREVKDIKVLIVNWWDQVPEELIPEIFAGAGFPGWDTEHAAITETSVMLYFAPDLVRKDKIIDDQAKRIPKYSIFPAPRDIIPESGVLYKATYASIEKGEKIVKRVTDAIVEIVKREFKI